MREPTYDVHQPVTDWIKFKQDRLNELNTKKVQQAVDMLRVELKEALPELRDRILENPTKWLGGRKDALCQCVTSYYEGNQHVPPKPVGIVHDQCFMCGGSGKGELPLHHGWGTGVRNLLRSKGFGEEFFDVWNLDDYYAQLVELAVAQEYDLCLPSLIAPPPLSTSAKRQSDSALPVDRADSNRVTPLCTEITTSATNVESKPSTSPKTRIGASIVWTLKNIRTWLVYPKKNGM